ncbi:hypothetical protein CEY16_00865 [Halalkalibacillus sediminis]|uniref:Uncharacterized protein n=1 Tax=Halalkalibacillus sediminis TaxID=2018042 RepID=A0A2I0QVH1_9BACI|nr:hypothetical protein [Halalkalibacillus sediminis]PKR78341.1 hypothetical protein CEY16_00865 [Halalkalibacillus sediminis]
MWQLTFFFIGFGFSCVGGVSIIGYSTFVPAGMSYIDFFHFIYKRPECYMLPIGMILMLIAMYKNPFNS